MDSLIIIALSVLTIARFWRGILAVIAGITATFFGGALVGLITGSLTYGYLSLRYPDPLEDAPEDLPEEPSPCISRRYPAPLTASARRKNASSPSNSATGGRSIRS